MAQFNLNRAQDVPVPTLKLNEITPKNWHKFPPPALPTAKVNEPPFPTYYGGDYGDDQDEASANATTNYAMRNQENKATALGTVVAKDVGRARGKIAPWQRYPIAGDPPVVDPTIASLAPATAVTNTGKLIVTVTGTGFSPWTIFRGIGRVTVLQSEYVSTTVAHVMVDLNTLPPGTYQLQAVDHNTESAASPFVVTATAVEE